MTARTDEELEPLAKIIASAMGDNYAHAFKNKVRWIAKRGMIGGRFRDVNEPYQSDYLDAAQAAWNWISEHTPTTQDTRTALSELIASTADQYGDIEP
jgi:hypothetical protein